MVLRILFLICCLNGIANAQSIVCPSIQEIKAGFFNGWLPLYVEGEELASAEDEKQFKWAAQQFVGAKWNAQFLENGHCFYAGGEITKNIILAQDAWRPLENAFWLWIKPKALAECHSLEVKDCKFIQ